MVIVSLWSIIGIGGIVKNAGTVIEGNKLKGEMVQREVDHLNWVNQVNALLTDEHVTELMFRQIRINALLANGITAIPVKMPKNWSLN